MSTDPIVGPLICGTSSYVDGTFVWTDYAYDDTGASAVELGGGAEPYPEDGANTADLIQLQLRPTVDGLRIRAVLQTLNDPTVPVLAVGFDTDCDPATGAPSLPGGRWRADPPLGLEWVVVVSGHGEGGELRKFADGGWNLAATFPAIVDPSTQVLETTVPRAALDPGRAVWRVVAAMGIVHDGSSFLDGDVPIYDLAFVGGERRASARRGERVARPQPGRHPVGTVPVGLCRGDRRLRPPRAR